MARIRSIHPGLFTDEAYASCSFTARVLLLGIWTECDDHGIFEWKPITLKMRIMPADNIDMVALLEELAAHNIVRQFTHDGREYGAVRNFGRFQRPKKPKYVHFMPVEFGTYVASSDEKGEPDDDEASPVLQRGELGAQMEDGGWKRKEEETLLRSVTARAIVSDRTAELDQLETELREAAGLENDPSPALLDLSPMTALLAKGYTLANDILPKLREAKARGKRGGTWKYYLAAITETKASNDAIAPKPSTTPSAPVAWINEDDPRFKPLADRQKRETGKAVHAAGSRHENGIGAHFPAEWVPAKSSVAA